MKYYLKHHFGYQVMLSIFWDPNWIFFISNLDSPLSVSHIPLAIVNTCYWKSKVITQSFRFLHSSRSFKKCDLSPFHRHGILYNYNTNQQSTGFQKNVLMFSIFPMIFHLINALRYLQFPLQSQITNLLTDWNLILWHQGFLHLNLF